MVMRTCIGLAARIVSAGHIATHVNGTVPSWSVAIIAPSVRIVRTMIVPGIIIPAIAPPPGTVVPGIIPVRIVPRVIAGVIPRGMPG
jgi:hypothetical protein